MIASTVYAEVRKNVNDPADGDERWPDAELMVDLNNILEKMLNDRPFLYYGADGAVLTFTRITAPGDAIIATIDESYLVCVAAGIAARIYGREEEDEVNLALTNKYANEFVSSY